MNKINLVNPPVAKQIRATEIILGDIAGMSTYEEWTLQPGNTGKTFDEFIATLKGKDGSGIKDILKKSTSGNIDTYEITFVEDGKAPVTFTVTNGTDGEDGKSNYDIWLGLGNTGTEEDFLATLVGEQGPPGADGAGGAQGIQGEKGEPGTAGAAGTDGKGISNIALKGTAGLVKTYEITYTDTSKSTYTVNDGNGISGIALTNSSGKVNTYTISMTDGTNFNFNVIDGADGIGGGGASINVVDNLASESIVDALSANQGKILNGKINALANTIPDKTITESHIGNSDIHVTLAEKTKWNDRYDNATIDNKIALINQFKLLVVPALPTENISETTIYFVKDGEEYKEYIYINVDGTMKWEMFGTVSVTVDISEFLTETEINALVVNKVDKEAGKGLSSNDYSSAEKTKLAGLENTVINDTLTSTSITEALSAAKGKELKELIDGSLTVQKGVEHIGKVLVVDNEGNLALQTRYPQNSNFNVLYNGEFVDLFGKVPEITDVPEIIGGNYSDGLFTSQTNTSNIIFFNRMSAYPSNDYSVFYNDVLAGSVINSVMLNIGGTANVTGALYIKKHGSSTLIDFVNDKLCDIYITSSGEYKLDGSDSRVSNINPNYVNGLGEIIMPKNFSMQLGLSLNGANLLANSAYNRKYAYYDIYSGSNGSLITADANLVYGLSFGIIKKVPQATEVPAVPEMVHYDNRKLKTVGGKSLVATDTETDVPIPTKINDLVNDSDFVTTTDLSTSMKTKENIGEISALRTIIDTVGKTIGAIKAEITNLIKTTPSTVVAYNIDLRNVGPQLWEQWNNESHVIAASERNIILRVEGTYGNADVKGNAKLIMSSYNTNYEYYATLEQSVWSDIAKSVIYEDIEDLKSSSLSFQFTNALLLGEGGTVEEQGFEKYESADGLATLTQVSDIVEGIPQKIFKMSDLSNTDVCGISRGLTQADWTNIKTYGASFMGKSRLDTTASSPFFYCHLGNNVDNKRYGLSFGVSTIDGNRYLSITNGSVTTIFDGNDGRELITEDQWFDWSVKISPGVETGSLYVNNKDVNIAVLYTDTHVLSRDEVYMYSGSSSAMNRVTSHAMFGVTIMEESSIKTIDDDVINGSSALNIFTPTGVFDVTFNVDPSISGRDIGNKIVIVMSNVGGNITLNGHKDFLLDNVTTTYLPVVKEQVVEGLNSIQGKNIYKLNKSPEEILGISPPVDNKEELVPFITIENPIGTTVDELKTELISVIKNTDSEVFYISIPNIGNDLLLNWDDGTKVLMAESSVVSYRVECNLGTASTNGDARLTIMSDSNYVSLLTNGIFGELNKLVFKKDALTKIVLTQAEYDALPTKDDNTIYEISDVTVSMVDISGAEELHEGILNMTYKRDKAALFINVYGNPDATTTKTLLSGETIVDLSSVLNGYEIVSNLKASCGLSMVEYDGVISTYVIAAEVDKSTNLLSTVDELMIDKNTFFSIMIPITKISIND